MLPLRAEEDMDTVLQRLVLQLGFICSVVLLLWWRIDIFEVIRYIAVKLVYDMLTLK